MVGQCLRSPAAPHHRISAQELPRLRETAAALAERGGPERLAAGLDALLDRFARE
ncbi:hypothetical protein [Streptomyces flaveus]|uniref:Uncharacterized protein n=1 Tax=Streptomyces flaveus TaxID=66370 RepID=A0A917VIX6_9ACTN|nr:hypothetical protein GCM10010094_52400 [Streptomyces flaveus]